MVGVVIVVGNEIVRGEDQDANYKIAASKLEDMGVEVRGGSIVRDEKDEIMEALGRGVDMGANLIVVSGGIGSTHDDVTREAVAEWADRPLTTSEEASDQTRGLERMILGGSEDDLEKVREMLKEMRRVPEGSRIVENISGINPGFILDDGILVVVLPGVPSEFEDTLEVALGELGLAEVEIYRREVEMDRPEAFYADALRETAVKFPDVGIGSYPKLNDANRVRFRGLDENRMEDAVDFFLSRIKSD